LDILLRVENILWRTHKAERDVIDTVHHPKPEVVFIFFCQGRRTDGHARQIHAFVLFQETSMHNHAIYLRLSAAQHAHFHRTIVEQDTISLLHILRQALVGCGNSLGSAWDFVRCNGQPGSIH